MAGDGNNMEYKQKPFALGMETDSTAISVAMLRAVIGGKTYDAVATDHGLTRTSIERRIKAVARKISREIGIDGINEAIFGRCRPAALRHTNARSSGRRRDGRSAPKK